MKSLKTEILINAPIQEVWKTLMDFESYPNWNPFIQKIQGNAKEHNTIVLTIAPVGGSAMTIKPKVLKYEESKEFRWLGHMFIPGLFDGEHYFQLEKTAKGTKLIHGENFSGIFRALILKMVGEGTQKGFVAMNNALKERVEK